MAVNQYVNKVVYGNNILIDLTGDTVTADKILSGYTAHINSGEIVTGTCEFDSDTSDDTAMVAEILAGKTAHARGTKLTGTMPNNGAITGTISAKSEVLSIPQGYHDGSGTAQIAAAEQAKIIPSNIKSGVEMLGVTGTYTGEGVSAQSKSFTPTVAGGTVLPDSGYDYLSQVTVAAIPYVETDNSAGGKTVTIAG